MTRVPSAVAYAPQLDGLRAVAVAAVAWSHWLPAYQFGVPLGAGVHLFFVLSGFLITRILLGVRDAPDRPRAVGRFLVRRALRLFPAFWVVLGLAWLADVPLMRESWPWHAAYLSNVHIAQRAAWQGHLSHFWSLAVEQQFYLVWPWLVVWVPATWLWPTVLASALLGPVAHGVAAARGLTEPFWALVPGGSADSLGVGALVALSARGQTRWPARSIWRWAALAGATCWLGLAIADTDVRVPLALRACRQLCQALVFGWVVAESAAGASGGVGRLLASRGFVRVGRISYGIYLVHPFAPIVVDLAARSLGAPPIGGWPPMASAALSWLTTVALATVLWQVVEAPAHRLKARL